MPEDPNATNLSPEEKKPPEGESAPKQDEGKSSAPPVGYVPEESYKDLQRKLANLERKQADLATLATGMGHVLKKVGLLEEVIMTQLPADSEQTAKLKASKGQEDQWQEKIRSAAGEIDTLAQTYGVTAEQIQTGPEFQEFRDLWAKGHVDAAKVDFAASAKSLAGGRKVAEPKQAPQKTEATISPDELEKAVAARLKTMGINPNVVDTKGAEGNPPKGKVWTSDEVNKLSPEEFEKNFDEIITAQNEGRYRKVR